MDIPDNKIFVAEELIRPLNLTVIQAKFLALLMNSEIATGPNIHKHVGVTEPKVAAHRLRVQLKKHDVKVNGKRFQGFWIDSEDKEKIRNILRAWEG